MDSRGRNSSLAIVTIEITSTRDVCVCGRGVFARQPWSCDHQLNFIMCDLNNVRPWSYEPTLIMWSWSCDLDHVRQPWSCDLDHVRQPWSCDLDHVSQPRPCDLSPHTTLTDTICSCQAKIHFMLVPKLQVTRWYNLPVVMSPCTGHAWPKVEVYVTPWRYCVSVMSNQDISNCH